MSDLQGLLERIVRLLDAAGVPFMIAGSVASAAHGLPRTTQDVDVVIDPPDQAALETFVRSLPDEVYYVDADAARDAYRRRSMFNVIDQTSGWKVDFIVRKGRAFSRAEFDRRTELLLLGVRVFVATPEDTIVAKLEWSKQGGGSQRQRRDIAGILATMGADLDHAYLEQWIADLDLTEEWALARTTET